MSNANNGAALYEKVLLTDLEGPQEKEDDAAENSTTAPKLRKKPDEDFVLSGAIDERILSILNQNNYRNIIYAGQSGVGRTAQIKGIARLKRKAVELAKAGKDDELINLGLPIGMSNRRFLMLDTNSLFDTDDSETIRKNVGKVIEELERSDNNVLVIEDTNDFLDAIDKNNCHSVFITLMRELRQGNFQAIFMVRELPARDRVNEVLEFHSEIRELFTVLKRAPSGRDETLKVALETAKTLMEYHPGLTITNDAVEKLTDFTFMYPTLSMYTQEQPGRMRMLLDSMVGVFVTRAQTKPRDLVKIEKELADVIAKIADKKTLEADRHIFEQQQADLETRIEDQKKTWFKSARELYHVNSTQDDLERKLSKAETKLAGLAIKLHEKVSADKKAKEPSDTSEPTDHELSLHRTQEMRTLDAEIIKLEGMIENNKPVIRDFRATKAPKMIMNLEEACQMFTEFTGIPTADTTEDEKALLATMESRMNEIIFKQEHAVHEMVGAIKRAKQGLKNPLQPILSCCFFGPSGVGKSFIAEVVAQIAFNDPTAITSFDMSEYASEANLSRLIGSAPGLVGYGKGGLLCNAVRHRSHQVILLDEIEKANPEIFNILLQILDKGRTQDDLGPADFRNTIIIMTSNKGQEHVLQDLVIPGTDDAEETAQQIALSFFGKQEIVNRIDVCQFLNKLDPDVVGRIVNRELKTANKAIWDKKVQLDMGAIDVDAFVGTTYSQEQGARRAVKTLRRRLFTPLSDVILAKKSDALERFNAKYDTDGRDFKLFGPDGKEFVLNRPVLHGAVPSAARAFTVA